MVFVLRYFVYFATILFAVFENFHTRILRYTERNIWRSARINRLVHCAHVFLGITASELTVLILDTAKYAKFGNRYVPRRLPIIPDSPINAFRTSESSRFSNIF
jgi:hypothetical protein